MWKKHLFDASRSGNIPELIRLLECFKQSAKAKRSRSTGAKLYDAMKRSRPRNINIKDENGCTALHLAAMHQRREAIEELLKAGADATLVDAKGNTVLHYAAWGGSVECCRALLKADTGSLKNIRNSEGSTALILAVEHGHTGVVDLLLEEYVDASIRNFNLESALDMAARFGRLSPAISILSRNTNILQSSVTKHTPLHLAAAAGHTDVARVLLEHGHDVNALTTRGSALHEAVLFEKADIVELLLSRGVDIHQLGPGNQSVWQLLAGRNSGKSKEILDLLEKAQDLQEYDTPKNLFADEVPWNSKCTNSADMSRSTVSRSTLSRSTVSRSTLSRSTLSRSTASSCDADESRCGSMVEVENTTEPNLPCERKSQGRPMILSTLSVVYMPESPPSSKAPTPPALKTNKSIFSENIDSRNESRLPSITENDTSSERTCSEHQRAGGDVPSHDVSVSVQEHTTVGLQDSSRSSKEEDSLYQNLADSWTGQPVYQESPDDSVLCQTHSENEGTTDVKVRRKPIAAPRGNRKDAKSSETIQSRTDDEGDDVFVDDATSDVTNPVDVVSNIEGLRRGSVSYSSRKASEVLFSLLQENINSAKVGEAEGGVYPEVRQAAREISDVCLDDEDDNDDDEADVDDKLSDEEDWKEVTQLLADFGRLSISGYKDDFYKSKIQKLFVGTSAETVFSVGDWLESLDLSKYENAFIAHGFDDMEFMGGDMLEEEDLIRLGICEEQEIRKILNACLLQKANFAIGLSDPGLTIDGWLELLHMPQYKINFKQVQLSSPSQLCDLTETEFLSLDVQRPGHRKRMLLSLRNASNIKNKRTSVASAERPASFISWIEYAEKAEVIDVVSGKTSSESRETGSDHEAAKITDESDLESLQLLERSHRSDSWLHEPAMLTRGNVYYDLQYLGSCKLSSLSGKQTTIDAIAKVKSSWPADRPPATVSLAVSYRGVKFIESSMKEVISEHPVPNILCTCRDELDRSVLAYVTKDRSLRQYFCHVFRASCKDEARAVYRTLMQAFELAYAQIVIQKKLELSEPQSTEF